MSNCSFCKALSHLQEVNSIPEEYDKGIYYTYEAGLFEVSYSKLQLKNKILVHSSELNYCPGCGRRLHSEQT